MGNTGIRRTFAALLATGLLLAGCSSDGDDATADGPSTTTADAGTTAPPDGDGAATTTTTSPGPLERYADYETVNYGDPAHWICRPDVDDLCDGDLRTTVIAADGTTTVEPFEADPDAPVDCFYVYPTISGDQTPFSDWDASPDEEGYVTVQQAARLGSACRVFAPIYRQATLPSLTARLGGKTLDGPTEDPYADVLDAFRTYMAEDNGGRGVVLIGHSQGAGMLRTLLAEEIDPNEDVRALLVSAYLAGTAVAVPDGELVGGDLANVPLCTADEPTGCVVTWSTFRATAPPPANAYFGRVGEAGQVAGCTNPADLAGEADTDLQAYFPADATASILSSLGTDSDRTWLDGPAGEAIDTPFVALPGLVSATCATTDGADYLSVTVHGDPTDPRADDISGDITPEWGLHLVDVSLVMGDIVDRVEEQAEAHAG